MEKLFRAQAIAHRKEGLHGAVLLVPHMSHALLTSALIAWVIVVTIWLCTGHYARKETVTGWLEPPEGILRIYSETTGVIQKVLVSEGETVTQDQPLLIISNDRILANGEHLDASLLREYDAQKLRINEQILRGDINFDLRKKDIAKRIASAQQDLGLIEEQLVIFNERNRLVSEQAQRLRLLKQSGHVSNAEFDDTIAQELALKIEKKTLLRSQITQKNTIEQLQAEQNNLPNDYSNSQDRLRSQLSDVEQQVTQLNGRNSQTIRAPRGGLVNNIQAMEGQHTDANNIPLLTLLSQNSQLRVHLLIPVRAIGFIAEGQPLAIRYDAFPYQKFGIYHGKVLQVSRTLLLPNELLNAPLGTKEPVYQVTALLESTNVKAYGKVFSLKPGMTLSADVALGERTLAQWLLEPIFSLQGRI